MRATLFLFLAATLCFDSAWAGPRSLRCVFDFDDSLILKISGSFRPPHSAIALEAIALFEKEEGAEDSDLFRNYSGPTRIHARDENGVSWKFELPSDESDYGQYYILTLPLDFERRLSVYAEMKTGSRSGVIDHQGATLSGTCTLN